MSWKVGSRFLENDLLVRWRAIVTMQRVVDLEKAMYWSVLDGKTCLTAWNEDGKRQFCVPEVDSELLNVCVEMEYE